MFKEHPGLEHFCSWEKMRPDGKDFGRAMYVGLNQGPGQFMEQEKVQEEEETRWTKIL